MKARLLSLIASAMVGVAPVTAQVTLSGLNYSQDFNGIGSGLPTGWSVYTSASTISLGTADTFSSAQATWASTTYAFRNVASDTITFDSSSTTQSNSSDRAMGWRPIGSNSTEVIPYRTGAVTFEISNTTGFSDFSVSLDVFQLYNTNGIQTYVFEYRVGNSGAFTQIGSAYSTKDQAADYTDFNTMAFSADSITLTSLNDQSQPVYFRLRGTSTAGASNLDLIGVDNFSLTYTAVPEPSTYAAILGVGALVGAMIWRRMRRLGRV